MWVQCHSIINHTFRVHYHGNRFGFKWKSSFFIECCCRLYGFRFMRAPLGFKVIVCDFIPSFCHFCSHFPCLCVFIRASLNVEPRVETHDVFGMWLLALQMLYAIYCWVGKLIYDQIDLAQLMELSLIDNSKTPNALHALLFPFSNKLCRSAASELQFVISRLWCWVHDFFHLFCFFRVYFCIIISDCTWMQYERLRI